jgi:hypothetical protein
MSDSRDARDSLFAYFDGALLLSLDSSIFDVYGPCVAHVGTYSVCEKQD